MKKLFVTIMVLVTAVNLSATSYTNLNFSTLNIRNGLSDNYVKKILRDSYGFIWVVTTSGLDRYDGYNFKHYSNDDMLFTENYLDWVKEDRGGNIWIKSNEEYYTYDRETDKIARWTPSSIGIRHEISEISDIYIDEDKDVWYETHGKICRYNCLKNTHEEYDLPDGLTTKHITCRNNVAYLLLSDESIRSLDPTRGIIAYETETNMDEGFHSIIYLDTYYNLWTYSTHQIGIKSYNTIEKEWFESIGNKDLLREQCSITHIDDEGNGNIWIGTDNNGVLICHRSTSKTEWINTSSQADKTHPNNHITTIYHDGKGMVWIGTGKQGIFYTTIGKPIFENITYGSVRDLNSIYEDETGELWLGCDGNGIVHNDDTGKTIRHYITHNSNIPSNLIVSAFKDSKGRLWWSSFGGGAFYREGGTFISANKLITNKDAPLPQYIRRIAEDAKGNLWFASYNHGLQCITPEGDMQIFDMDNSIFRTNYIADITCKDGKTMYIVTSSGIYIMDTFTKSLKAIRQDRIFEDEFGNCLFEDSRDILWIGGRTGISIWDTRSDVVVHLDEDDGLSHNYIRGITEDRHGNIWLSTDNGLTHVSVTLNRATGEKEYYCTPYYGEDGLSEVTFNNFAAICDSKGNLVFGCSKGMVRLEDQVNEISFKSTKVMFTECYLGNDMIDVNKETSDGRILLTRNIMLAERITLKHNDINFSIDLSTADYSNLHKIKYEYRLSDSESWVQLENNRITFNRLTPGKYTLEARVANVRSTSSYPPSKLMIEVTPPGYRSRTAYIIYILGFIVSMCAIFQIIQLRNKRLIREEQIKIEIQRQHELDQERMRFFTNISHDLRTPLSLIINPLESLKDSSECNHIKEDLNLMYNNAMALLNEVNQLLEFRKIDQQRSKLNPAYGNLSDFIKGICKEFSSIVDKKGMSLSLHLDAEYIEMCFDHNKMKRIMLNLLSNAVKYNNPGGSITVSASIAAEDDKKYVELKIADTGIGIEDSNKERIFERFFQQENLSQTYAGSGIGLNIVKEYVSMHSGEIKVYDNHPKGSIFVITLPLAREEVKDMTPADQTEAVPGSMSARLLIVEDNDDFREFLYSKLKNDYEVYTANNGKVALGVLNKKDIDIVITDVMMPVIDGLELCCIIKNDIRMSHIPVIMLTARGSLDHMLEGLSQGADEYISKPFNMKILLIRINKLLAWTKNNHEKFGRIDVTPSEITISSLDEQLISKAISLVESNIDNSEYSVEDLSYELGMSRSHLYKKLLSVTGKSPLEFIRVLRIKRGRQLLDESQMDISQIAYKVGFSPKQFSRYFKEEYGKLPSEYLKDKADQSREVRQKSWLAASKWVPW